MVGMSEDLFVIWKNNNTRTVQAESSKFASLSFDQGYQIVIPPRFLVSTRTDRNAT